MSKRKVPAALHRELSEYASLLRALRTRDTMDVTKYLTKPSPFITTAENSADLPMDEASSSKGQSQPPSYSRDGKKKHVPRDHWTRWPLMLHDVLQPEWTLEDEVAVLASQVLKARSIPFSENSGACTSDEESQNDLVILDTEIDDDDPDPAFYVPYLTYTIANFLSTTFAELASHTPARPPSMQNRIEPLNWRAVIDAVVSSGNAEPECVPNSVSCIIFQQRDRVVQNVIRRMEATYGPTPSSLQCEMPSNYQGPFHLFQVKMVLSSSPNSR